MFETASPILPTRDIDAVTAFYGRIHFVVMRRDGTDYVLMKREGAEIHFFLSPDLDPLKNEHGAYLRAHDIDTLSAEIAALGLPEDGVPRFHAAEDKPWGMRELTLIDPDGNLIRAGREIG